MCPWDGWAPGTVSFCEDRLCAWVVEPSNTASSGAYLLAAAWMARDPARSGGWPIIVAQVMIGLGSMFFHGTGTFVGEMVDQTGMYLLSALILTEAIGASARWSAGTRGRVYAAAVVGSTLVNLVVRPIGIPLFAAQLALGVGWQVRLGWVAEPAERTRYPLLWGALGVFGGSFTVWALDIGRVWCDPDNHWVTGHAVWHCLNAVSTALLGRFYARGR